MGFFDNIGRTTNSIAGVIVTSAEAISTVANAGKISADVLVIKANSLKQDSMVEATYAKFEAMKKLSDYKTKIVENDEDGSKFNKMKKDFEDLLAEFE